MTNTIEIRANLYEKEHKHNNIFIAYADGAADQKQIDIDRACRFLVKMPPAFIDSFIKYMKGDEDGK